MLFVIAVIPVSAAGLTLEATNQDELISALNMTQVVDAINITQSFTVDKNCAITYGADKINYYSETVMTVENGVTLTIRDDGALGSVWATFEGSWDDPILPNGKCINNGTLILEAGGMLDLDFDTNNGYILVKNRGMLAACITNNGTIDVEDGGIFASGQGGEIYNNGTITIPDGARISSRFGSTLHNAPGGVLVLDGEFNCGCVGNELWFKNEGTVEGRGSVLLYEAAPDVMPADVDQMIERVMAELGQTTRFENWDDINIYVEREASTYEELAAIFFEDRTVAGEHVDGNMDTVVRLTGDITVTGEISTMGKVILSEQNCLIIADGGILEASLDSEGYLLVQEGGTLATTMNGVIHNKGTIEVSEGGKLVSHMGGRILNEIGIIELEGTYTEAFRTVVIGSALGSELIYITANVPENVCLVAARFDKGVLTDVKIINDPKMTDTVEMDGTGEEYKLFLLDLAECKPFCENWKNF